jgi:hypothetical protein
LSLGQTTNRGFKSRCSQPPPPSRRPPLRRRAELDARRGRRGSEEDGRLAGRTARVARVERALATLAAADATFRASLRLVEWVGDSVDIVVLRDTIRALADAHAG